MKRTQQNKRALKLLHLNKVEHITQEELAQIYHMTQGAISRAIKRAEAQLEAHMYSLVELEQDARERTEDDL